MELFQLYYNLFRKSTYLPGKPSIPSNIVTNMRFAAAGQKRLIIMEKDAMMEKTAVSVITAEENVLFG